MLTPADRAHCLRFCIGAQPGVSDCGGSNVAPGPSDVVPNGAWWELAAAERSACDGTASGWRTRKVGLSVASSHHGGPGRSRYEAQAVSVFSGVSSFAVRAHGHEVRVARSVDSRLNEVPAVVVEEDQIATQPATELVSDAVFAGIRPGRDMLARLGRLRHGDRLRAARWSSDLARRHYYAEPGGRIREVAVDDGFGMDVTRCVVAEYFGQLGEAELCQRVICHQDVRSAEHHGITLVRSGTLVGGADRCDFRYHVPFDTAARRVGRRTIREVSNTVRIDAPPERVWEWLTSMTDHYTDWHPDHVSAHWEHGPPNQVGSILVAVEYLGGRREELRFEMTEIDPPHTFTYRILGLHGLLLPGGAFTITPDENGSSFTAAVRYRLGPLTERLLRRRVAALETRMRQEGEKLKRLIESDG